ncbi:MAG TPA: glucose dehydrogenase [Gammaproteobacteria bacterium]|nr:glucose dehydrogenase [Gammaproteobacteria bacterium]
MQGKYQGDNGMPANGALMAFLLVVGILAGCGRDNSPLPAPDDGGAEAFRGIALTQVFNNEPLSRPLAFIAGPANSGYVVEQAGRILRLLDGQRAAEFADIRRRVDNGPNEAGLLGMAFDPAFATNGRVYLSYTRSEANTFQSVISRFLSRDGGLTLDTDSEQILLTLDQPYSNHNGGQIAFGPDGYLYIGFGDGGSGGDPDGNGQDTDTLLGAMLRIDVSGSSGYTIPADNPFAQGGGRAEIYAWGLRNPWRWSFDRQSGDLWLADVGQNRWEEVNRIQLGGNYGWNIREGAHCSGTSVCDSSGLIDPVAEYPNGSDCSVTGGYVYRGTAIADLNGVYLYGDYCSGKIWGLFPEGNGGFESRLLLDTSLRISSFGEDSDGEVYVVHHRGGIYRIDEKSD